MRSTIKRYFIVFIIIEEKMFYIDIFIFFNVELNNRDLDLCNETQTVFHRWLRADDLFSCGQKWTFRIDYVSFEFQEWKSIFLHSIIHTHILSYKCFIYLFIQIIGWDTSTDYTLVPAGTYIHYYNIM